MMVYKRSKIPQSLCILIIVSVSPIKLHEARLI